MTEDTIVMSAAPQGACQTGHCGRCPGGYRRFYIQDKPKKGQSPVVFTGEYMKCPHWCHNDDPVPPKKRKTKK